MKRNQIISTGAALAAMILGSVSAEAGGSRHYSSHGGSCGYRAPVVVAPRCGYYPRPVVAPVYYRPAIVSAGWGYTVPARPVTSCNTTVYRTYDGWNGGYVEQRRTVCQPVYPARYPVYRQPACGYRGGGYSSNGYRSVTVRF